MAPECQTSIGFLAFHRIPFESMADAIFNRSCPNCGQDRKCRSDGETGVASFARNSGLFFWSGQPDSNRRCLLGRQTCCRYTMAATKNDYTANRDSVTPLHGIMSDGAVDEMSPKMVSSVRARRRGVAA